MPRIVIDEKRILASLGSQPMHIRCEHLRALEKNDQIIALMKEGIKFYIKKDE